MCLGKAEYQTEPRASTCVIQPLTSSPVKFSHQSPQYSLPILTIFFKKSFLKEKVLKVSLNLHSKCRKESFIKQLPMNESPFHFQLKYRRVSCVSKEELKNHLCNHLQKCFALKYTQRKENCRSYKVRYFSFPSFLPSAIAQGESL